MGAPSTPEDLEKARREHDALIEAWNQLGLRISQEIQGDKQPVHPPAAIASVVVELTMAGFIPTFPIYGTPEDQMDRDAVIIVGAFRWAQQCFKNGVLFDDLLKCTCADVKPEEFDDIYKYLQGDSK